MRIELVIDGESYCTWQRGQDDHDTAVWVDDDGDHASPEMTRALDTIASDHDRYSVA